MVNLRLKDSVALWRKAFLQNWALCYNMYTEGKFNLSNRLNIKLTPDLSPHRNFGHRCIRIELTALAQALCDAEKYFSSFSWICWTSILAPRTWNFPFFCVLSHR